MWDCRALPALPASRWPLAAQEVGSRYSSASGGCLCLLGAWAAPGCDCPELSRSSAALMGCELGVAVLLRCPAVSRRFLPSTRIVFVHPQQCRQAEIHPQSWGAFGERGEALSSVGSAGSLAAITLGGCLIGKAGVWPMIACVRKVVQHY